MEYFCMYITLRNINMVSIFPDNNWCLHKGEEDTLSAIWNRQKFLNSNDIYMYYLYW